MTAQRSKKRKNNSKEIKEESFVETIGLKLKELLFNIYYNSRKEEEMIFWDFISSVIFRMQLVYYFATKMGVSWPETDNNGFIYVLSLVFVGSDGYSLLINQSYLLIFNLVQTGLILFAFALLFSNSRIHEPTTTTQVVIRKLNNCFLTLLTSILLIPFLSVSVNLLFDDNPSELGMLLKTFLPFLNLTLLLIYIFPATLLVIDVDFKKEEPLTEKITSFKFILILFIIINIFFIGALEYFIGSNYLLPNCAFIYFLRSQTVKWRYGNAVDNGVWKFTFESMLLSNYMMVLIYQIDISIDSTELVWLAANALLLLSGCFSINLKRNFVSLKKNKKYKDAHLWYLIHLYCNKKLTDKNKRKLNQFIDEHSRNCSFTYCHLKNEYLISSERSRTDTNLNQYILHKINQHIIYEYEQIMEEPNEDIQLTLNYIYFLFKVKNDVKTAFKLLKYIKYNGLSIQQEFIIHSIIRLYNEQLFVNENFIQSNFTDFYDDKFKTDTFNKIASYIHTLNKRSIILINQLLFNNPDINIVLGETIKIANTREKINYQWRNYKRKSHSKDSKMFYMLIRLFSDIINEDVTELKYLAEELKNIEKQKSLDFLQIHNLKNFEDFIGNSIIVSGNQKTIGQIKYIKPQTCLMFGYYPEYIIGKNIKLLMPEIFRTQHNTYINEANKSIKPRKFAKFREIYGKCSNGYIIPMFLRVRRIVGIEVLYLSEIKRKEMNTSSSTWLTDDLGNIIGISKESLNLFKICAVDVQKSSFFDDYFPGLFKIKNEFINNDQKIVEKKNLNNYFNFLYDELLMVKVDVISYSRFKTTLYLFTFNKHKTYSFVKKDKNKQSRFIETPDFNFAFDPKTRGISAHQNFSHSSFNSSKNKNDLSYSFDKTTENNFDSDILTLQLRNGKVIVKDINESEATEEDPRINETNTIKRRFTKTFSKIFDEKDKSHYFKMGGIGWTFFLVFNILFALMFTTGVYFLSSKQNKYNKLDMYLDLYFKFGNEKFLVQIIGNSVNDFVLVNDGNVDYINLQTSRSYLKDNLFTKILTADRGIYDTVLKLNDQKLIDIYFNTDINCYLQEGWVEKLKFYQLMKHFNSKVYGIISMEQDNIDLKSKRVKYVNMNTINDFWIKLKDFNDVVVAQSEKMLLSRFESYLTSIAFVVLSILFIVFYFVYERIMADKIKKGISRLLYLQDSELIKKKNKIMKFSENFYSNNFEDLHIEDETSDSLFEGNKESDEIEINKKHFSSKPLYKKASFISLICFMLIALISSIFYHNYFAWNIDKFGSLQREFDVTMGMRSEFYSFTTMSYNHGFNKGEDFQIYEQKSSEFLPTISEFFFNTMIKLGNYYLQNSIYRKTEHNEFFYKLLKADFCQFFADNNEFEQKYEDYRFTIKGCRDIYFSKNEISKKLTFLTYLVRYHQNIRILKDDVTYYLKTKPEEFHNFPGGACTNLENYLCILKHPVIEENFIFKTRILNSAFYFFSEVLRKYISEALEREKAINLLLIFSTIIFLIIFYILFVKLFFLNRARELKKYNIVFTLIDSK